MADEKASAKRLRIACCSTPYSGHIHPLVSLAEGLAAKNTTNDVFFVTFPYAIAKIQSRCQAAGIQTVPLSIPEEFDSEEGLKGWVRPKIIFPSLADHFGKSVKDALDAIDPDVIVSDHCCLASQNYAISNKIPLVINWPGPIRVAWGMIRPVLHLDSYSYFARGGLFVSYVGLDPVKLLAWLNVRDLGRLCEGMTRSMACGNSMVLIHSFWGLERPEYLLHSNMIPIGPIGNLPSTSPNFSQSHPELASFLHKARNDERKILLVTTGTMIRLEEWMVQLLWKAFEILSQDDDNNNHTISIVWSLPQESQDFLSKDQLGHEAFFINSWLPQPALLASDLVDGVLTHCGWNGSTECLVGGKPIVALPFFADQMANAKLLVEAGCATQVAAMPAFNTDSSGHSAYVPVSKGWLSFRERISRLGKSQLTVEGVVEGCRRIMKDPSFRETAKKLQALSTGPGKGREFACDLIEHAGHHGLQHLSGTHVGRLTGHRPLFVTLAMVGMAGAALARVCPVLLGLVAGSDL